MNEPNHQKQLHIRLLGMLNIMDSELSNCRINSSTCLLGMLNIMDSEQLMDILLLKVCLLCMLNIMDSEL